MSCIKNHSTRLYDKWNFRALIMCIFCVLICSQKAEVFRLVLRSEDELFHVSLYDWLFSMNLTDRLLEVCIKGYSTVLMLRPLDENTSLL